MARPRRPGYLKRQDADRRSATAATHLGTRGLTMARSRGLGHAHRPGYSTRQNVSRRPPTSVWHTHHGSATWSHTRPAARSGEAPEGRYARQSRAGRPAHTFIRKSAPTGGLRPPESSVLACTDRNPASSCTKGPFARIGGQAEGQSARWRRLGAGVSCSPSAAEDSPEDAGADRDDAADADGEDDGETAGVGDVAACVARGSARCAISRSSWSKIGVDITFSRAIRALLNVKPDGNAQVSSDCQTSADTIGGTLWSTTTYCE